MVAVAFDAAPVEDLAVDARRESGGEDRVAGAAHVGDGANARRRRAVIAVTIVARRRRWIVPFRQRRVVDAPLVLGTLTRRDRFAALQRVSLHVLGVRMTGPTGRRDICGEDRRARVVDRSDPVRAMTARAGRNLTVAG